MSDLIKQSLRIDWFDGSLMEDTRQHASGSTFDEEEPEKPKSKAEINEKKPIGYKRLFDLSQLNPPVLNLEISNRPGFWNLLDTELKGDFIVLIVKTLSRIYGTMETGENSKMANLLKKRLEPSMFMDTLKTYLEGLPKVKTVDKRMNLQLWNDIQSFFMDVVILCEGATRLGLHDLDYLIKLNDIIDAIETSAIGVEEEHLEKFSDELFLRIVNIRLKLKEIIKSEPDNSSHLNNDKLKDASHFTNLSIFPSTEDLLGGPSLTLKPNIINGAYESVEEYLDLQFKLLREDCFGPLREGICKYMENPSKRRHENIRVYPKVRIIRTHVSNNKVGHLVDIAWTERLDNSTTDFRKYAYSKQLMYGSLILFTCDSFKTILCATVLDSNMNLLSDGYIAVQFQSPVSHEMLSRAYTMVESEVFFEPYRCVLKVLQQSNIYNMPMKKYIVDVHKETQAPSYLSSDTIYSIKHPKKDIDVSFPVLNSEKWPKNSKFGLDESQFEAYKLALTREFAVIQGPPGTGKTFIGIKIASTILQNLSLEGTPMLVICYTNHALDQFLEGILKTTASIIRLGSQSKSEILVPYNLNAVRTRMKSKYSYLYSNKRRDLEKIFKDMTDLQTEIEKCEKEIVCYEVVKPFLEIDGRYYSLKKSKEDSILSWLFNDVEDLEEGDDWETQFECASIKTSIIDDRIETCFSENWAEKEIKSMQSSIKYANDLFDDISEGEKMSDKFEIHMSKMKQRLQTFKKWLTVFQTQINISGEIKRPKSLYDLKEGDRWMTYFRAVNKIKDKLIGKINDLQTQHATCSLELEEVSTLIDSEVMKSARVVGVTTTAAARRHDLLKKLASPIVIAEEAAEVLEAHIVASLTQHCQHLILIGDHKQLRPSAAHYKLAKDYNLEISLFERMIRNGIHARSLATQRRMRPNFVELIVPTIYDKLRSHSTVLEYPDVKGMKNNLFFYSHNVFEDSEGLEDSWSHKNSLEAKWCVALADYLRQMKHAADDITILTTYTGQANLIKEHSKKYDSLRNVKITVVDNYQGEESKIVILSLVRSNRDGKIGFLSAANRICVALSRAKEGFYIFGNMGVLKSASVLWRHINDRLVSQNAIGQKLLLRCEKHRESVLGIQNVEDFKTCLKGTCLKKCNKSNESRS